MNWITEDGILIGYMDNLPAAVIWRSKTEKCWVVETIINGKRKRIATRQLLRDAREQAEAALTIGITGR